MYVSSNKTPLITANTSTNGASGEVSVVLPAQPVPTYIRALDFQAVGTNAATVVRVFLSKEDRTAPGNSILWKQYTLASTTASQTAAPAAERKEIGEFIDAGWQIFIALGTAGTDGWRCNAICGDYSI